MLRSPPFTFGISGDFGVETGVGRLTFAGNLFHSDHYYWYVNNRTKQPGYTLVNGEVSLTLPGKNVRVSAWGRNLTNAVVYSRILPSATADIVGYDRPRTYGVSLDFVF